MENRKDVDVIEFAVFGQETYKIKVFDMSRREALKLMDELHKIPNVVHGSIRAYIKSGGHI